MSLKQTYYAQQDSVNCTPDVVLTGDPGTDQQTLTAAGYLGGVIVGLKTPSAGVFPGEPSFGAIGAIAPCDTETSNTDGLHASIPFATLINGPGEFSGAIGPSGSKKAPVLRALWQGAVDFQGYGGTITNFVIGQYLFCGNGATAGKYVGLADAGTKGAKIPVGICTHVPTAAEPWLGVASLL